MPGGVRILVSDAVPTRLGRLLLTGEVIDADPGMPRSLRVMDAYVLSVVQEGQGSFVFSDGREEPIGPGTSTVVPPHQPHWYGTARGERWTELFAVFTGPLFDTLAAAGVLADTGPQARRPTPSIRALRTLLCAPPRSPLAAEHQLMALADWLLDTRKPPAATGFTPVVAAAVDRLSDDLDASIDMKALAAELGLPYHTFRRRFTTEVGLPPTTFRSTRRIQTAATLLRLTNMSVRQIASTLGYTDEFHLSRRFHTYFGVPPSKYRRSG